MRNMTSFYQTMTDKDLRVLESKKILRGMRISKDGSWFAIKERATLRQQIMWIRAELALRKDQLPLGL